MVHRCPKNECKGLVGTDLNPTLDDCGLLFLISRKRCKITNNSPYTQIISHSLTKKGEKSIFFVVYSALEVGLLIIWSGYLYICILIYMKTIT